MGHVFVVAIVSSRVIHFDANLKYLGEFKTNIFSPWGITIDKEDTMYIANFSPDAPRVTKNATADSLGTTPAGLKSKIQEIEEGYSFDMQGVFGVTVIKDMDDSSAKLMTVPTGGDEVMLRNGFPLYGTYSKTVEDPNDPEKTTTIYFTPKCYQPIMRLTSTSIDGAGNLWAANNWKPAAAVDVLSNPGGDGVVIYIGVAEPA
jgi:hypothetical protein